MPRHREGEIGTHGHEQEQRHHLERQAGNHDIHARLLRVVFVARRRNGTSGRLQNQREDVETDEGDGIDGRTESRNGSAVDDDDAGQAEIDGGAEEGWGDGEADEVARGGVSICWAERGQRMLGALHLEPRAGENVVVQLDSGQVTENLQREASDHAAQKTPCAISNAEEDLRDQNQGEEGQIEGIPGQGGDVINLLE